MNIKIKVSSIICGLLFLSVGVLLILFNANVLHPDYKKVVFSWQMFLIALGFVFLFSRYKWIFGIILMLVGGFFLLPKLNIEGFEFISQNGWAIFWILVGVFVICSTIWRKRWWRWSNVEFITHKKLHSKKWKNCEKESGYIEYNCVFSGNSTKIDNKNFKGGEINGVFGGIELDLSEAQLAEGTHHLELNSVFGGVVLFCPIDWKIDIRQTQVFGQFVDNRPKPDFEVDENRALIIEANSVFGGGEIKCK